VPIDAGKAESRPYRDLKVTQTLDERSHKEKGCLYLEVKASAHGLVPPLTDLFDTKVEGLETGAIEDRGLRVVELDAAAEDLSPISEHEWRIELKPKGGSLPASFQFPAIKPELAKEDGLVRQRYVDVDLVPAEAQIALGGGREKITPWIAGSIAVLLAIGAGMIALFRKKPDQGPAGPALIPLPSHINAVSVIGYLRKLQEREGISPALRESIEKEITILETRHFGREDAPQDPVELEEIAKRWQAA
jgi:hypothetical protein